MDVLFWGLTSSLSVFMLTMTGVYLVFEGFDRYQRVMTGEDEWAKLGRDEFHARCGKRFYIAVGLGALITLVFVVHNVADPSMWRYLARSIF